MSPQQGESLFNISYSLTFERNCNLRGEKSKYALFFWQMLKWTMIKQLLIIYEHELFDYCLTDALH